MDASIPKNYRPDSPDIAAQGPEFLFLLLQIAAFWNVWQLLAARFAASGEAIWEILPLLSVFFFSWAARPKKLPVSSVAIIAAAFFLVVYAATFTVAPPLIRAFFAITSITFIISSWRFGKVFHSGIFILFLMSLPLTDSLDFFLGYPMRAVVGEAVAFLLNLQGLDVYRDGVCLHFGEKLIWIDAPCSGIKMLWFGTFLATFLSCLLNFGAFRLLAVLASSFIAIISGNILRASALFYMEGGLIDSPEWMHPAVGVIAFAFTTLAIVFIVKVFSGSKWQK